MELYNGLIVKDKLKINKLYVIGNILNNNIFFVYYGISIAIDVDFQGKQ
jgi:hypothetical protein